MSLWALGTLGWRRFRELKSLLAVIMLDEFHHTAIHEALGARAVAKDLVDLAGASSKAGKDVELVVTSAALKRLLRWRSV